MESDISELMDSLRKFLFWDKRRLYCFTAILRGLFIVKTVNLAEIATALPFGNKLKSKYKRIQRFFKEFEFDISVLMNIVFSVLPLLKQNIILSVDRTNWKLGKQNFNILFFALYFKGYAIPLAWTVMTHRGCSNGEMRIHLLKKVLKFVSASQITAFLGDREFIGKEWIQFLYKNKIPFYIRLKSDLHVQYQGQSCAAPVSSFFRNVTSRKPKHYRKYFEFCECTVYLSGRLTDKGELMVIVTNQEPHNSFKMYRKRWSIENLFGCLKTRGFRLEETHLTHPERLSKLIFVLSLAFFIAIRRGTIDTQTEPIKTKTHGRPEKSIFRRGLDSVRSIFIGLKRVRREFYYILSILRPITDFKHLNGSIL